jgi:hypothetical protein
VLAFDDVTYLIAQREIARCAKMTCRLMRAALRRCGVMPNQRRWLELLGQDEFETMLQRHACQKSEPAQGDEDRVVELPARAARRSAPAPSAPAPSAEETDDGTRLIPVRRAC